MREKAVKLLLEALESMAVKVEYCETAGWWPVGHKLQDPLAREVECLLMALDELDQRGEFRRVEE